MMINQARLVAVLSIAAAVRATEDLTAGGLRGGSNLAFAFDLEDDSDVCHENHASADACDADPGCAWCECSAIPSACYSIDAIDNLPEGVFDCHKKDLNLDDNGRKRDLECISPEHETDQSACLGDEELRCTWCEMADDQKGPRHRCYPRFSKEALMKHNATKGCQDEDTAAINEDVADMSRDAALAKEKLLGTQAGNWLGCYMMANEDDCLSDNKNQASDCAWCTVAHPVGAVIALCEPESKAASLVESGYASSCVSAEEPDDDSSSEVEMEFVSENKKQSFLYENGLSHALEDNTVDPAFCDPKSPKSLSGYVSLEGSKYDGPGEDKHYFYWFFESRDSSADEQTPLFIWLTGGPGCSSTLALLAENGPCSVSEDGSSTIPNEHSWNSNAHALWLDQPTGVGYSYGKVDDSSEEMVGENAYYFLQSFLQSHPEYQKNPLFITGESYAGHYVPAITHRIWQGNNDKKEGTIHLNLQGMAIGNGLTNPEIQYPQYAEMAVNNSHNIKVLDEKTYEAMKKGGDGCTELIHKCNSVNKEHPGPMEVFYCQSAMAMCNMVFMMPYQMTGLNPYDIREMCKVAPLCYDFEHVGIFLNADSTKEKLHITKDSSQWASCNFGVHSHFNNDWMKDMSPQVADILNAGLRVLVYAGDVDFICNYLGNRAWTLELEWDHKTGFNAADDHEWNSKTGLAKTANGFTFLQVYDAGHMVPMNQPKVAVEMINQFFKGEEF